VAKGNWVIVGEKAEGDLPARESGRVGQKRGDMSEKGRGRGGSELEWQRERRRELLELKGET